MSLPLLIKSKLFWRYNGNLDACWYLGCGDGATVARQNAYIADMDRFGVDTITINVLNEGLSTLFTGQFMASDWDMKRIDLLFGFITRLKARGKNVVIVFFDCPQIPDSEHPKYPFWKYKSRIPLFLELTTQAFAWDVDGFILGIETNRGPLSAGEINAALGIIKEFAWRDVDGQRINLPVGTHEQSYRIASNADFIGYETKNHPVTQGDSTSVAAMVADVKRLVARAGGKPCWIIESNSSEGAQAKAQNKAMAELAGVIGVNMPM